MDESTREELREAAGQAAELSEAVSKLHTGVEPAIAMAESDYLAEAEEYLDAFVASVERRVADALNEARTP